MSNDVLEGRNGLDVTLFKKLYQEAVVTILDPPVSNFATRTTMFLVQQWTRVGRGLHQTTFRNVKLNKAHSKRLY
jgi:hypothetical protein